MLCLSMSLDVVLPAHKIPEEIAPIHEVDLIGKEEADVLHHGGHTIFLLHSSHPVLILVLEALVVHAREPHVVGIAVLEVVSDHLVTANGSVGRRSVDGSFVIGLCHPIIALLLKVQLAGICRSVKQRCVAILLARKVAAEGEHVVGGILVHGRTGTGSDKDDAIGAVAQQQHGKGQQAHACRPVAAMPDADGKANKHEQDQTKQTAMIREGADIDKEQLEKACQPYDTGNDAIEHQRHNGGTGGQSAQDAPKAGTFGTTETEDQHHGRNAQQIEQMHANGKSDKIGNENEPTAGTCAIGLFLPLQHEPEDHSREKTGIGIDLGFGGGEPEGVTEGIGQRTHHTARLYQKNTLTSVGSVRHNQLAGKVCNGPEEEKDAACTEEG